MIIGKYQRFVNSFLTPNINPLTLKTLEKSECSCLKLNQKRCSPEKIDLEVSDHLKSPPVGAFH